MSTGCPIGRFHPGPAAQRLGLRPTMCAAGNRPWRAHSDGARWTIADWGLVQLLAGIGVGEGAGCPPRPVQAGDVLVLLPKVWHAYGPRRGGEWPELCVFFAGPAAAGVVGALGWNPSRSHLRPAAPAAVQAAMERLVRTAAAGDARALVPMLLDLLMLLEAAPAVDPGPDDPFAGLAAAVRADPLHPWDFAAEARRLRVSASTLRRRLAALVGAAPLHYLAEQRIRLAAGRLRQGLPVAEAGRVAGFADPAHFSRRFRALTGLAPSRYAALPDEGAATARRA